MSPRGKMWSFIEKGGVCGVAWLRDEVDEADDLRPIVSLTRSRPVAKHADQAGVLLGRAATSPDRAISVLSLSSSEKCAREGDSDSCGHAQVRASGQPKWDAVGTGNGVSDQIREVDQRVDEIGQSVCVRQAGAGVRRPQAEDKRGDHGCGLRGDSSLNVEPEMACRSDAVREQFEPLTGHAPGEIGPLEPGPGGSLVEASEGSKRPLEEPVGRVVVELIGVRPLHRARKLEGEGVGMRVGLVKQRWCLDDADDR